MPGLLARWWLRGVDRADGLPAVQARGAGTGAARGVHPDGCEIAWAREPNRTPEHLLALVVLLKACHRLGYFPGPVEVRRR
jgi:hypothetical protein